MLKLALAPVLVLQALHARRSIPRLPEALGPRSGCEGGPDLGEGHTLSLLVAGDSSAAGVGVDHQHEALAQPLAQGLAARLGRPVAWQLVASSGLDTAQTLALLEQQHPQPRAELVVVVTGVNDVVERHRPARAVEARAAMRDWLQQRAGARHVVFVPLPPVHAFHGLPQPLRWVAGRDARRHNLALQQWLAGADAGVASLASLDFPLDPAWMARDGFHPGVPAYRAMAAQLSKHLARVMRQPSP